MEEFEKNGIRIQRNTTEEIREEYRILLNHYRKMFFSHIVDLVQEQIRGIPEHKIEEWIEDYLISEIKVSGNREINRLSLELESNFKNMTRSINNKKSVSIEEYQEELNNITRRTNCEWIEDISSDFIKQFSLKLENYYDVFHGISDARFQRNLDNIKSDLRSRLRRLTSEFVEEYKRMLKDIMRKNANKVESQLQSLDAEEQLTEGEIRRLSEILECNDYELIHENDKLYAKNKKTSEITELTYIASQKLLSDSSKTLGIQIKDDKIVSVDRSTDKMIFIDGLSILICNLQRKNAIAISQGFVGYDFFINYKKVTTPEDIMNVIEQLKSRCPAYYNKLYNDPEFRELLDSVSPHKETPKANIPEEKALLEMAKTTLVQGKTATETVESTGPKRT